MPANGQVAISFTLIAASGLTLVQFHAVFTATPLRGYDAILGVTWLAAHDVRVGWRNRTIEIRTDGRPPQLRSKPVTFCRRERTGRPVDHLDQIDAQRQIGRCGAHRYGRSA